MKLLIVMFALSFLATSCGTLHSTTYIDPKDSFILGNNQHGSFYVKLKNDSKNAVEVYHAPVNGGRHSSQIIAPSQSARVKIDKNTAFVIDNKSVDTAVVSLVITGDTGLSMGYKN
jgi:hypothetical protein